MEENKSSWSTLVKKYLRDEITPEEKDELEQQMQASPIKQRQFHRHTDQEAFRMELKEMYYADRQGAWESFKRHHNIILK